MTDVDVSFDDHVDDVYADVTLSPSSSFTSTRTYTGAHNNARISFSFRVRCNANYYGSDCATYCVNTDNSNGHYTCGSSGQKICLAGWSQPATNCLTGEITVVVSASLLFVACNLTWPAHFFLPQREKMGLANQDYRNKFYQPLRSNKCFFFLLGCLFLIILVSVAASFSFKNSIRGEI